MESKLLRFFFGFVSEHFNLVLNRFLTYYSLVSDERKKIFLYLWIYKVEVRIMLALTESFPGVFIDIVPISVWP